MSRLILALTAVASLAASLPGIAADKSNHPSTTVPGAPTGPMVPRSTLSELKTLSAPAATAKFPVDLTLTDDGKNKSCVVAVDWGDGSGDPAMAIPSFPAKLTHTYLKSGLMPAKVTGVKTCTGMVQTTVKVMEVNSAPITSSLTSVIVSPSPLMVGQSSTVTIKLSGNTANCVVDWDYGDGTQLSGAHINGGALSDQRLKTYTSTGTYTVKAHGKQSCAGDVQTSVTVNAPAVGQQGSGNVPWNGNGPKPITIQAIVMVTPPPYAVGQTVQWKITGVDGATCNFGLSQGNQTFSNQLAPAGSPQAATANVLDKVINFPLTKAGLAIFGAQPDPTAAVACLGGAQTTILVQ